MAKIYSGFVLTLLTLVSAMNTFAQVSVTASGGTTGPTSYTTVKAAFDAVNAGTHTGTITVNITANTTETATALLNPSGSGSASYTGLTLKPGSGVTATINGNFDDPVIAIAGSNVTIDGSNSGSTSRDLTISNSDTSLVNVIAIVSAAGPVTNVTVKNTVIRNAFVGLVVTNASFAAGEFSNIVIENNNFQELYWGIFAFASVSAGNGGITIRNNEMTSSGANSIYNMGIYVQGSDGATINGNNLANFDGSEEENDIAIWLATGTRNATVDRNRIHNIGHTGGEGWGGHGIRVSTGTPSANVRISNNMISNIVGDGWDHTGQFVLDNPIGIALHSNQSGISVNYNTVFMTGNMLNNTGSMSMGVYLGDGTTASIVNNIIVNNLGLQGSTGHGAVGVYARTNVAQFSTINYNNYYVNPTGGGNKFIGQIGSAGSATLAAFQTATGGNANSKNVLPVFVSATDLHLVTTSNAELNNAGTPIAGITTDFDGQTRSTTTPDLGADEFDGPTSIVHIDSDVTSIRLLPNIVDGQAVLRIQARKSMNISWVVTDAGGRTVMSFSRQIMAGQNDLNLNFGQIPAGVYHIMGLTDKGKTEVIRFVKQ